jgi:hypothetical protein
VLPLTTLIIRLTIGHSLLLARMLARLPLPWVLTQDTVALTPEERFRLTELLPAWHVGRRSAQRKPQARPW